MFHEEALAALDALPRWQALLVVVAASLLVARAVQVGGDALLRRLTARIDGEVDDAVLRTVHPALYLTVVLAGAYLARGYLELGSLAAGYDATLLSGVVVLWALTLVRVGSRVSAAVTARGVEGSVVPVFQNVWSVLVAGAAAFALLALWKVNVTPLLASAGIVGIIVGFAAKDTVANLFGSIALYFDGTYEVGDFVVLDSGERGRVEDVSIRSTVLRTRDDVLVTVPNAVLNSARIVNESEPRRRRRIRVPVGVAYGSDLDAVETLLLDVADAADLVLDSPSPRVRFREFGESALALELLVWIRDPVLRGRAVHRLNGAIYRAFADAGVEIPYPKRDVRVVDEEADGRADVGAPADPDTEARRSA